jgi:hypothetical protein
MLVDAPNNAPNNNNDIELGSINNFDNINIEENQVFYFIHR